MPDTIATQSSEHRVLVFPAMTPPRGSNKHVYFLFSVLQIEDIIKDVEMSILDVPFSPKFAKGIANWRNNVVPLVSLEESLGLEVVSPKRTHRMVIVRAEEKPPAGRPAKRSMLRVAHSIRMLSLPIKCKPLSSIGWIPRIELVRGVYEWDKGYFIVVHLKHILSGTVQEFADAS